MKGRATAADGELRKAVGATLLRHNERKRCEENVQEQNIMEQLWQL